MNQDNIIILLIPVFLLAVVLHEIAHAYAAKLAGDMTATRLKRLSLNPIHHIDPVGTVIFPILAYISNFPLFGWAKPVPVDPTQFRRSYWEVIVSLAGVTVNLIQAIIALILYRVIVMELGFRNMTLELLLLGAAQINLFLMVFNLLPIPPLDGSHVVQYYVTRWFPETRNFFIQLHQFGFFVLIFFLMLPPTQKAIGGLFFFIFRNLAKLIIG
jgi:Zn-dependent protease